MDGVPSQKHERGRTNTTLHHTAITARTSLVSGTSGPLRDEQTKANEVNHLGDGERAKQGWFQAPLTRLANKRGQGGARYVG